jgi:hypothetical protein
MSSLSRASRWALVPALGTFLGQAPASAEEAQPRWATSAVVGPTLLLRSKSKAVGHLLKPHSLLSARRTLWPRLEVGGALTAILDSSEHYRVLGGLALARYAIVDGPGFSLGATAALGLGYDADILHKDLKASSTVIPYGYLATDGRWTLGRRWQLGAEAGWENLSMLRLGVLVGFRWGKELP